MTPTHSHAHPHSHSEEKGKESVKLVAFSAFPGNSWRTQLKTDEQRHGVISPDTSSRRRWAVTPRTCGLTGLTPVWFNRTCGLTPGQSLVVLQTNYTLWYS